RGALGRAGHRQAAVRGDERQEAAEAHRHEGRGRRRGDPHLPALSAGGRVCCPPMPDTPKIVVTRRIPEPAVELLKEAGDVWVSPDDRPLSVSELHDAIKGADIVVTLLHDKVDDAFFDAAGDQLRAVCTVAVRFA